MDDGSTFDYKEGDYISNNFTFKAGVLSCTDVRFGDLLARHPDAFRNRIERIVILGLKNEPVSVSAEGVDVAFSVGAGGVVLKNPHVAVGISWSIELK